MAVKINNIEYSGFFFFNGEALTAMYLNGNKVYGRELQPVWTTSSQTISYTSLPSTFNVGDTHSLGASTSPIGGTLSYSSSNPSVATVDSNGIVTAVAEGNATITISVGAWDDNANHIHYTSASTTVSVEVRGAIPTSPVYFDASNPGNVNIQTITDDGLSGVTMSRRGSKTVYFNVESSIFHAPYDYYKILTDDVNGKFYYPDGSLINSGIPTSSGVEIRIFPDYDTGAYKLVMPGRSNAYTKATFKIIPHSY